MAGLDVALGIVQGLEQARETMREATVRKTDLEQKKQKFDMEMKINKLKLQQVEDQYDPELIELEKKRQKTMATLFNTELDAAISGSKKEIRAGESDVSNLQGLANKMANIGVDESQYGLSAEPRATRERRTLEQDLVSFDAGEIAKDDMIRKYPQDVQAIEKREKYNVGKKFLDQPLEKPGLERVGKASLIARARGQYSAMNSATKAQVDRIKAVGTYQAILDMFTNRESLQKAGVNTKALEDYYSEEIEQMIAQGILKTK